MAPAWHWLKPAEIRRVLAVATLPLLGIYSAMAAADRTRGGALMESQAEQGLKLLKATEASGAEYDVTAAEAYRIDVEVQIAKLEMEATQLTGKDNKKERSAKGKEVADLKNEHKYVDACKIVKGLEPKFGFFITKEAVRPEIEVAEPAPEAVETKPKKEPKKEKKADSAGLSHDEMKELEDLKQKIVEEKAILKEEGMSGGQINKNEKIVAMVTRLNELKEKQDPGSSKKEKDAKKDSKKKTPLSAEEQKEYAQLQGDIEVYKAKLRNEFGYSNKDMKADPDLKDMEARLAAFEKRS